MSDTSIRIRVHTAGWKNGVEYRPVYTMDVEPEQSLVSIVDSINTTLDDFRVKSIEVVEEQR